VAACLQEGYFLCKDLLLPKDLSILCLAKDLSISCMTELSKRSIIRDCAENGAHLNMVARKLNQTGYIRRHCDLVNTEAKVKKVKNALQLTQQMDVITKEHEDEAAQKKYAVQIS
jgi:hypothetical protein